MSDRGKDLTRREFDAVIRRAAELASSEPEGGGTSLSEGELFRIAAEVGLPERHVRSALEEVRSSGAAGGTLDRFFGPAIVRASRVVPGTPEALGLELDDFLVASQLLQRVRRGNSILQYRPAVDWASQLARAASFTSSKYYVASAKSVEVRLEVVDDARTHVEIVVDPGTRNDDVLGAAFGGGVGGAAAGTAVAWGLASAGPVGLAVGVGVVVGAGVWSGIAYLTGRSHKGKMLEVRTEVLGILDSLETGDPLEPPPPSWRRWVKRQFHGMARDLRVGDEDGIG